jgi:uncharacterized membrane protein YbhN (UPF0104 family)
MNAEDATPGNDSPSKVYRSKRDGWLVGLLWFIIAFCVAGMVYIFYAVSSIPTIIAQEALFLILVAFTLSILRNTYYVLESDHMLIRSGWFRWRTKYSDIVEVRPTRKIWSSAALSMDRLYIRHRLLRSSSFISPEDKEEFMRDLATRAPGLVFEGNRLVRREPTEKPFQSAG